MEEINWKKERNGRNIKKKWKRETVKQNRDKKERAGGKDSRKERKEWNERKRWKNGVIAGEKSKGSEVEGDQREKDEKNKEEERKKEMRGMDTKGKGCFYIYVNILTYLASLPSLYECVFCVIYPGLACLS